MVVIVACHICSELPWDFIIGQYVPTVVNIAFDTAV